MRKIFHRFALQFGAHALVNGRSKPTLRVDPSQAGGVLAKGLAQVRGVMLLGGLTGNEPDPTRKLQRFATIGVHAAQSQVAESLGGLGLVQLRATVDRMHRLARGAIARINARKRAIGCAQRVEVSLRFIENTHGHAPQLPRYVE